METSLFPPTPPILCKITGCPAYSVLFIIEVKTKPPSTGLQSIGCTLRGILMNPNHSLSSPWRRIWPTWISHGLLKSNFLDVYAKKTHVANNYILLFTMRTVKTSVRRDNQTFLGTRCSFSLSCCHLVAILAWWNYNNWGSHQQYGTHHDSSFTHRKLFRVPRDCVRAQAKPNKMEIL